MNSGSSMLDQAIGIDRMNNPARINREPVPELARVGARPCAARRDRDYARLEEG
jgi:hypothetical protein